MTSNEERQKLSEQFLCQRSSFFSKNRCTGRILLKNVLAGMCIRLSLEFAANKRKVYISKLKLSRLSYSCCEAFIHVFKMKIKV